jgi:hypothetical protein
MEVYKILVLLTLFVSRLAVYKINILFENVIKAQEKGIERLENGLESSQNTPLPQLHHFLICALSLSV